MAAVEDGMRNAIERMVRARLNRELSAEERTRILKPRSLMAYEAILDYLPDSGRSEKELEAYLEALD